MQFLIIFFGLVNLILDVITTPIFSRSHPNASLKSHTPTFLSLPPELRLEIYKYLFRGSKVWVVDPKQPDFWKGKRRSDNFNSNRHWMILLTCKLCFAEASQLFVEMTSFTVGGFYRTHWNEVQLLRFAENISNYSRVHLSELRKFLSGSVQLSIQAIPLFPNVRTCILSARVIVYSDKHCLENRPLCQLPNGYMEEYDVKQMLYLVRRDDGNISRFISLILSDEYRYMRHIDFILQIHHAFPVGIHLNCCYPYTNMSKVRIDCIVPSLADIACGRQDAM